MDNERTSSNASHATLDSSQPQGAQPRTRWYTPGFSDAFGDRLLMFDNSTASSLELLRFGREIGDTPGFETALRQRVDALREFRHPSVANVRKVEWLGSGEEGLALVSNHTPGRRLSELLYEARGPVLALELLRQIAPVLAALQHQGSDISHGTLTADRIVVTPEGRLILVEHVLGSAAEALNLATSRLRSDFGLIGPTGQDSRGFDCRGDVIQLAFVAMSLVLGRRLSVQDYPANVPALLDELGGGFRGLSVPPVLKRWLERALQAGDRPFANAQQASDALYDLPNEFEPASSRRQIAVDTESAAMKPAGTGYPRPQLITRTVDADDLEEATPMEPAPALPFRPAGGAGAVARRRYLLPVLSGLVAIEALVIAGLVYTRPTTVPSVIVSAPAVQPQPPAVPAVTTTPALPAAPPAAAIETARGLVAAAAAGPSASRGASATPPVPARDAGAPSARNAAAPLFGGLRISSTIDLQVFEAGRLVGSTAGPMAIGTGSHVLDLVNESLGFRTRQLVQVTEGQMASLSVATPNGRLSVNALPWADILIDGNPAGQTPLANLSVPIGTHEVIFRHPQFPEQRQTVTVKVDALTRVGASLEVNGSSLDLTWYHVDLTLVFAPAARAYHVKSSDFRG